MSSGKIIVIEGTDCSGKETQTKKLVERLRKEGKNVFQMSFPQYETPSGRIVGGPFLGKDYICEGWFPETAPNVDPLVSICYYAADRRYNIKEVKEHLEKGDIVILDRYVESNMAHQGCKCTSSDERLRLFRKIEALEFDILELPRPDAVLLLYMPLEYSMGLKKSRSTIEKLDQNESNLEHLKAAEETYLQLAGVFDFQKIDCVEDKKVKSVEKIHEEVYEAVAELLK